MSYWRGLRTELKILLLAALISAVGIYAAWAQRVQPAANQTGGSANFHLIAAGTNNSTLIAAGLHTVYSLQLAGLGSAPAYVKLYDKATAPSCGTDTPIKTFMIPSASTAANGAGSNVIIPLGVFVGNGLGICVVTGIADNDNTAVASATFIINIDYL